MKKYVYGMLAVIVVLVVVMVVGIGGGAEDSVGTIATRYSAERAIAGNVESSVSSTYEGDYSGLNKLEVSIPSMSCSSCSLGIASILNQIDGVVEANIYFAKKTGEVIYDSSVITQEEIMNSDAFDSYPASIISDVKLE